jgi:hypothetical protein
VVATACPAVAPGTAEVRPEVAEIFRRHGPAYLRQHELSPQVAKVLRNIVRCRTAALGGHAAVCEQCGGQWLHYNSCFDRHCPTCQGPLAAVWTSARLERLVPTHHFHVVATCPAELRAVALANPRLVYDLLFAAVSETLLELAADRWEALPAITAVLHTWNRQMGYHPHVHCIVTGGGLSFDRERWVPCRPNFVFPVKVLSALIRGKFMDGFVRAYEAGRLRFAGTSAHLDDPDEFAALRRALYDANWVVYAKRPFGDAENVIRYLSRYTHRVAISSSRLVSVDDDGIVFRTKGDGTCRLHPDEFIRRFLLHVLPKGFRKIRHYGLSAPSNVRTRLPLAQRLAGALNRRRRRVLPPPTTPPTPPRSRPPRVGDRCPACALGVLVRQPLPLARGPPVLP